MCGIFGYITSKTGRGPDIDRLRHIATVTQTRGDHAFGLAWLNRQGQIQTFKRPGPAQSHLDELERCRDAVILVGHCRYATHGSPADNRNNHPHHAGGGELVHNGVVVNHQDLIERFDLRPSSECDSEVLGLLIARCPGAITQRAAWAVSQAMGDLALLGIWRKPARLLVVRRGRPLYWGLGDEGYYLASLPDGLPGRCDEVRDHRVCVAAYRQGILVLEGPTFDLH